MSRTITIPKYNSSTAAGTLSGIARQYGTTVNDIVKANTGNRGALPNPNNPNLIRAGASLTIPDGLLQTTTPDRKKIEQMKGQLQQMSDGLTKWNDEQSKKKQEKANATDTAKNDGTATTTDTTKQSDNMSAADKLAQTLKVQAEKDVRKVQNDYARLQSFADAQTKRLVAGLTQKYEGRIEMMKDSNDRILKIQEALGYRQGRARYAPITDAGILTEEEMKGHGRIMEIEGQMIAAIAEAEAAALEGKQANLKAMYDRIDKTISNMQAEVKLQYEVAEKKDKEIRERQEFELKTLKDEFDMQLTKAEAVSASVAAAASQYTDEAKRLEFLTAYAEKSGIGLDILLGAVETASTAATKDALDIKKKEADIQNVQDTIANRNRNTDSLIASRGKGGDANGDGEADLLDETQNILNGVTKLTEVRDAELREKVKRQLTEYGYFSAEPPLWFVEDYVGSGSSDRVPKTEIQSAWQQLRKERGTLLAT